MGKKILPTTQTYQHQPSLCNVLYIYRFQLHRPPHVWAIRECLFPNKGPDHVKVDCSGNCKKNFCWMRKFKNQKSKNWKKPNLFIFYFSCSIDHMIYNPAMNLSLLKPIFHTPWGISENSYCIICIPSIQTGPGHGLSNIFKFHCLTKILVLEFLKFIQGGCFVMFKKFSDLKRG